MFTSDYTLWIGIIMSEYTLCKLTILATFLVFRITRSNNFFSSEISKKLNKTL